MAFVIAEIGSNWKTLEDCLHSVSQAKLTGAQAVKFQLFSDKSLYGFDLDKSQLKGFDDSGTAIYEKRVNPVKSCTMPREWLSHIYDKCQAVGIEFMCTGFSPEEYEFINPFVKRHKIASSELTHKRILEKVKSFNKPVYLSTAACMPDEIENALEILGRENTTLLYCVGSYPARIVDLSAIAGMHERFKCNVGYSDHTTDVLEIPITAVHKWGAKVLEKHVTFINDSTPDSPHSLTGDEFKLMTDRLKNPSIPHIIGPKKEEKPFITRHKRRLIAITDIEPFEVLVEGVNFGIFRSLKDDHKAMHGFAVDQVNGRPANNFIPQGDGIGPQDVA